jgi:hypothetical protein
MSSAFTQHVRRQYGPWAVVTGASDGIGRAFAIELARHGLNLVLVARREPQLLALADELQRTHGIRARVLAFDLAQPDSAVRLDAACDDIDVGLLVAAAGFGTSGPLLSSALAEERSMLSVNCDAVLAQCWWFGQRLRRRGSGGVVLMSSLLAFQGTPRAAHYAATKAYIQSLAEGLRVEWAPHGVDVIACAPGPIASGFAQRANMVMNGADRPATVAQATLRALGRRGTVRPGLLSKLLGWSLATLPRWAQVRVVGQVMAGMTAHQQDASTRALGGPPAGA